MFNTGEHRSHLTFRWKTHRVGWRLPFFLLASFLAHVFAFYVFRVVYPPNIRVTPQPTRVMLLQPSNPHAARLLRVLEDRADALGTGMRADDGLTAATLAKYGASFRPSFQGHEIPLRDLAPLKAETGLPSLLGENEIELPEIPLPPPSAPPAAADLENLLLSPTIRPGREFAGRAFEVDRSVLQRADASGVRFRVMAAVRADGGIQHLMIDEDRDTPLPENIAPKLRAAIRFAPAEEKVKWGWIEVIW